MTFAWADDIYYNEIQLKLQKEKLTRVDFRPEAVREALFELKYSLNQGDLGKWITNFFRQDNLPDLSFA